MQSIALNKVRHGYERSEVRHLGGRPVPPHKSVREVQGITLYVQQLY